MATIAAEPEATRLGTLRNGGKPAPMTPEIRAKGHEVRRRKRAEREMSRRELAHHKLAELLKVLDENSAQDRPILLATIREALDRDEGKAVQRVQGVQVNVTASLSELTDMQLHELEAELAGVTKSLDAPLDA